MSWRVATFFACLVVLLVGSAGAARANATTDLPFASSGGAWLAVDPAGSHVFVSGGPGTSSIVVLDFAGKIVKTITGQGGASQMALDTTTHTLYVALHDQSEISAIDTQTLTETTRFSTAPYANPSSLAIAGGKLWFTCLQGSWNGCPKVIEAGLDGSNMAAAPAPFATYSFATALAAGGSGNKYLAVGDSASEPPDVDVYDVSGASPTLVSHVHNPNGDSTFVRDMAFDPSGANLLLACGAFESLATATLLSSAQYPTGPYPVSVAVTADGKFVAGGITTDHGPNVFVYAAGATKPVRTMTVGSYPGVAHGLAFSPDGSKLFAVGTDATTHHLAFNVIARPTVSLRATTTSLTGTTKSVDYGRRARLTVHVTGTSKGKVDLDATVKGGTTQVASGAVKSGEATFVVTPKQNTTYSAQLEEGTAFAASTSKGVKVTVRPRVTVTAHALSKRVVISGHRLVKVEFTGRTRPPRPSIVCGCGTQEHEWMGFVVQQRITAARWRTVFSVPSAAIGGNNIAGGWFATGRPGVYRVQAHYRGDAEYLPAESAWEEFTLRG